MFYCTNCDLCDFHCTCDEDEADIQPIEDEHYECVVCQDDLEAWDEWDEEDEEEFVEE